MSAHAVARLRDTRLKGKVVCTSKNDMGERAVRLVVDAARALMRIGAAAEKRL